MSIGYYILDGKTPVPCEDIHVFAAWFEGGVDRRVDATAIGNVRVSTVFLGHDHAFGYGPPLLFETMVFSSDKRVDGLQDRCSTWPEAEAMHANMVARVKAAMANA